MQRISPDCPAALVIAHPGHELRVFKWLSLARPIVFVLTDGSGHLGKSRLHHTTEILESLGSRTSSIYGRFTDKEIYSEILNRNFDAFVRVARELAGGFARERIEYVVGDAIEGYNPAHDVCRLIIDAAVKKACQWGQCVQNFEILLTGKITDEPGTNSLGSIRIDLDDETLAQKLKAARDYSQVAVDFQRILVEEGEESLKREWLRLVRPNSGYQSAGGPVYYESYGEQQVARGYYQEVIRFREHVMPIAAALEEFAETNHQPVPCGS